MTHPEHPHTAPDPCMHAPQPTPACLAHYPPLHACPTTHSCMPHHPLLHAWPTPACRTTLFSPCRSSRSRWLRGSEMTGIPSKETSAIPTQPSQPSYARACGGCVCGYSCRVVCVCVQRFCAWMCTQHAVLYVYVCVQWFVCVDMHAACSVACVCNCACMLRPDCSLRML